ncbi:MULTISPECIES: response regulator transcription factor [Paraburkholderia]|uniref:Response regulator transcription factor n=1 Tax=Paraburkholderia madseniana TaxID=2599607 RepID=A0AAP5EX46_9BURK|nr:MULTISPECIES: response regulator transcription factor [Paraburkholderia]MCX4147324.1 response regulator transcription factor [Paraburkholderia madseniana]MDN7150267.1 response regulator transcription factor [Paraburkholderia sp. WS6]MDQ6409147.1 response regulator transcription factor [Paraburkholderia madseniana]
MHGESLLLPPDTQPELPDDKPVVLIVDDTPDNLALLSDTLQASGYAVLVALDGQSALQRLARITPDAVLLDALMPGMDGFETCRQIKADPRNRHLPVIFMTALTDSEHVVQGFRVGGIDYVTKPVKPSEVSARIAAHVQRSRQQRQADMVLDIGMRAALIAAASGEIRWQSDLARQRLARYGSSDAQTEERNGSARGDVKDNLADDGARLPAPLAEAGPRLPQVLSQWLARWIETGCDLQAAFETAADGARRVARVLGRATRGDWVILLEEFNDAAHTSALGAQFNLTAREAEVLLWLSRGKTNRDIGDILGMAPRTVNKHLEHVFGKLHVETRAAAAAIAAKASTRY